VTASIRVDRSLSYSASAGTPSITSAGIEAGDVVIVVHSCDFGSLSQMTISGGGWQLLDSAENEDPFGDGGGTKVWRRVATSSEPSSYTLHHAGGAYSVLALLAIRDADPNDIVIDVDIASAFYPFFEIDSVPTPGLTPPSGSGLEIRAGIAFSGFGDLGVTTHWTTPGSTQVTSNQSGDFIAMVVAQRQLVSSAPVDPVHFANDQAYSGAHGITIIIPASQTTAPAPPDVPSFTPGAARACGATPPTTS
jgi:hypothetical protein